MGSCVSAHSGDEKTVNMLETAKVVTVEGALREYSVPTKVSDIILDHNKVSTASASFLCSSDELDLGKDIPALNSDKWIEIGQIYFVLPQSMLGRPLKGHEMAALAVKASTALAGKLMERKSGGTSEKRAMQIVPVLSDPDDGDERFDDPARTIKSRKAMSRNYSGTKVTKRGGRSKSRLAAIKE